ncbi:peroxisomal assembly protein [Lobulomyces angularis]|nr:peroxisomal assembly protein [Lobulomyces angularis]
MSSILQSIIENASINAREFSRYPVIVVATSLDVEKLSSGLQSCFQHHFIIKPPNELERTIVLENLLKSTRLSPDISLKYLATQTAAFGVGDLVDLVANAGTNAVLRIKSELDGLMHEETIVKCGCELSSDDFIKALDIPSVEWEDIGGLSHVKNDIADTIQLPLLHPELFTIGMKKRSGVLLYGPPGTGKTLVAKAVATTFSLNFLSVKGPELLNMYIGESEQNVRNLFQKAREAQPCVLFFDELDSLAPKRGEKGDSGGVMDRIVSQLLAELDQVGDSGKGVFIIGATNRPELLDSALLRPGRFDKLIYLGVSKDHVAQLKILEALTRKFKLSPDLVLSEIANKCPFNYTGADFYALCSDAMLKAMLRVTKQIDAKIDQLNEMDHIEGYTYPITADFYTSFIDSNVQVIIEKVDFETALQELVPSVSIMELKRYEKQREIFEGTVVKSK